MSTVNEEQFAVFPSYPSEDGLVPIDNDLPPDDRRDRPGPILDANDVELVVGAPVSTPYGDANVVSHGRGEDYILVGYLDDSNNGLTLTTLHRQLVEKI